MNVANLILHLKAMITDNTLDQAMVSKAIKLLELGAVYQADNYASLPTSSVANAGQLYYVRFDGLYWSTGEYWIPIVQTDLLTTWSWGRNDRGQLGDNSSICRSSPINVVGGFTDWCQISSGIVHSTGVRCNGTLWAWGCNGYGRLGNNSTIERNSPILVLGSFNNWCQAAAGDVHSLGVRTNGTAWAWGNNNQGRLGNDSTISRSSPVSVVGGFTDWCQVAAGCVHSLGLRTNGTVWSWGCNATGQLGDGTSISRSSPVSVVGGFTDWCQVSAKWNHVVAIRTNGTAWAWGCNSNGQLGDGTAVSRSSPVSVVGGFTDWCQVSVGNAHSLGVRCNGTAWAWGVNQQGQLGDNTNTAQRSSPVSVVGGFTDWCQVSAGYMFGAGVRTNGTLWAWGCNGNGRLGDNDGTVACRSSPVSVTGGFTDWYQISTGCHTMAIRYKTL
jgi:alpha-tubulin suppressor-like RCC1 family protein